MLSRGYQKLEIDFPITEDLENAINIFVHHINYESGTSEDCYRTEIHFWLKDSQKRLTSEQYETIKQYYVLGGIYKSVGYPPWEIKKTHTNE